MHPVFIDRETQARRIASARVLRGLTRDELSGLFVAEGFGKHDIPRLERGDPAITLTRPRCSTLARLLEVPESWFTAPDEELFAPHQAPDLETVYEAIRDLGEEIAGLRATPTEQPSSNPSSRPGEPKPEEDPPARSLGS